jgi:glycosyltransferase involved in cell wall biosynthesis
MKLVVFSNLYPPLFLGGYELGAAKVVEELKRRGHEVLLLSSHEYFAHLPGGFVHRAHTPESRAGILDTGLCVFGSPVALYRDGRRRLLRKLIDTVRARRGYRAAIERFAPDAFLAFNPLGVAATVLDDFVCYARKAGVPVSAYVSDGWLAGWPSANPMAPVLARFQSSTSRAARAAGSALRLGLTWLGLAPDPKPAVTRYLHCSDFILRTSRANAAPAAEHAVVHWGLDPPGRSPAALEHFTHPEPLTLLFAGRIVEQKGLAVLVEALARCRRSHRAVVIGDDATQDGSACKELAARLGVADRLTFTGMKPTAEMADQLARSGHVLVVPSVWDEPFSIVVLEGMSLGLAVVASDTGGTAEAILDGETGLLFPRGDAGELAAAIDRLEEDRPLCQRLGAGGRERVLGRFTLERMVDQLLALAGEPPRRRAAGKLGGGR